MYNSPLTGGMTGVGMGALAATGSNLAWWIFFGLVLLIAGLVLLHTAQRRIRVRHNPDRQDG